MYGNTNHDTQHSKLKTSEPWVRKSRSSLINYNFQVWCNWKTAGSPLISTVHLSFSQFTVQQAFHEVLQKLFAFLSKALSAGANVAEKLNYRRKPNQSYKHYPTSQNSNPKLQKMNTKGQNRQKQFIYFLCTLGKWQEQKNNCLNSELDRWCIIHWHFAFVSTFQWMSINPVLRLFVQLILGGEKEEERGQQYRSD
jgi:hypothetical protein